MDAKTEAARRQMIDQQVRAWAVLDPRVLETLAAVPRERFVPDDYRAVAFADAPIPIGHGQWMLPPALEGRILQALAPVRGERVLELGTGTGFFAACLAHLTGSVDSIEIHAELCGGRRARDRTPRASRAFRSRPGMRSHATTTATTRSSRSPVRCRSRTGASNARWRSADGCSS
jgi:protein-L-isoaspartate O-methyltransferase